MNFLLDYFFSNPDDIPEDLLWSAYDRVHITWLVVMGIICFFACRAFKKSSTEKQDKILKIFAVWIGIQEIIKDILHYYAGTLELEHLPFHFCGISIFFSLWYAFSPNDLNGAYIYGMSLPGALSALLFPNWMQYPWWHFSALNSFTIHGELVTFALLALTSWRLIPNIKKLPQLTAVIIVMGIPIYFLNKRWDTNFMFINDPSPGSPLIPLYNVVGDRYVIAALVIMVMLWVIGFLPWEHYRKTH